MIKSKSYLIDIKIDDGRMETHLTEYVNGVIAKERFQIKSDHQNGDFYIKNYKGLAVLQTWFGLRVQLRRSSWMAEVWLPASYMGKTMGLCGNFNGNKLDDFDVDDLELDVNSKKDGQKFANEWIVEGTTCDLIDDIDDQIDCKDEDLKNECEKFLIEAETLNQCRMYVDVNPYYEACLMDYCQVSQDPVTKCGIFEAYINECYSNVPTADQGSLCGWTAETECSDPCPLEGEVWEACADPLNDLLYCPSTEPEIQFRSQRNDQDQMISPAPLCVCDNKNGFVLRNETCVKQEDCGCNADGRWVENGYETISRYCDFRCSCENNKFSCGDFKDTVTIFKFL